ncbi:MAG TPA: lanthionine synthetase LanC family protein [Candidatus Angelobacter sp.]
MPDNESADGSISPGNAIEEAIKLAAVLRRQCVQSGTKSVNWNSFCFDPASRKRAVRPMNFRLYDGICGPALFLAALERVTGGAGCRDLLVLIADQLMSQLGAPEVVRAFDIGAATGVPSVIYTLARIAAYLEDTSFLDKAVQLACLLSVDAIRNDSAFDLMGGSAGCIVALLAVHRMRPGAGFLIDLAIRCGEHLLACRKPGDAGLRSWPTYMGRMQSGFAHGAAGIAYALAALYKVTTEETFRDAAVEACAFENTLFVEETGNWQDYAGSPPDLQYFQWCHGVAGIGLGRLGMLHLDSPFLQHDGLGAALQTAVTRPAPLDHACCGNVGRVELLLVAGMLDELYDRRARLLAGFILRRARARGNYGMGIGSDQDNLSFHQGISGIGYQWLRLADPILVPSVLLWQ